MKKEDIGFLQWFNMFEDGSSARVDETVDVLRKIGCTRLRTGLSWAEYIMPAGSSATKESGRDWYARIMRKFKEAGIDVLANVNYTPVGLAEVDACGKQNCSHPPKDLNQFGEFVSDALDTCGESIEAIQFLNESHLDQEWKWELDKGWKKLEKMLRIGSKVAKERGHMTVMGGVSAHKLSWLKERADNGILEFIDIVTIHAFPGTPWGGEHQDKRVGEYVEDFRKTFAAYGISDVWVAETGFPTLKSVGGSEEKQAEVFERLIQEPELSRVYWYSLFDLHPDQPDYTSTQFGLETREEMQHHFGMLTHDGKPKLLYKKLTSN